MESEKPGRKHPAHGVVFIAGQPTIIFDTVCTKDRTPWLAKKDVHDLLRETWRQSTAWLLGKYVIMPDHIHYFAGATGSEISFERWVRYWKSQFTRRYGNAHCRWQTDHWDTRLRSAQTYLEKWEYIRYNSVRHGLVEKPEDWPYQGEVHELHWE